MPTELELFCARHLCHTCKGSGGDWHDGVHHPCYACECSGLTGGQKMAQEAIKIWRREVQAGEQTH